MIAIITLLGFVILICLSLWFNNKVPDDTGLDLWRKFNFMFLFVTVLFFFMFMYFNSYTESDIYCGPDITTSSPNLPNSYEFLDSAKEAVGLTFTFDPAKFGIFRQSVACFYYNNTDNGNRVRLVLGETEIDGFRTLALGNNTVGQACFDLPNNITLASVIGGVRCIDCSPANTLGIGVDTNYPAITRFRSTTTDVEWQAELGDLYVFESRNWESCARTTQKVLNLYIRVIGVLFFVFFGFYLIRFGKEFLGDMI